MPKFRIEQYETHVSTYDVEADTEGEAIKSIWEGSGDLIYSEYIECCDEKGIAAGNLTKKDCEFLNLNPFDHIPSIRSIKEQE